MANRTYLSCTDTPAKYQDLDAKNVNCAASYMVPVFWYILFNENNLVQTSTPCDDDEPDFEYSWLLAKKHDAISLAKSRLPVLIDVFVADVEVIFNTWLGYIESCSGNYICVETCELVMMDDEPSVYTKQANNCIRALSEPLVIEKGFLFKKKQANPKWAELLGQAEISDMSKLPEIEKLCGYSWENPVPWD